MTSKAIYEAALKLPPGKRARLASQLLDSLDEGGWTEAVVAGARIAEKRLRDLAKGKTKGIPESEAHRILFDKKP
jgi:hypothetical protein